MTPTATKLIAVLLVVLLAPFVLAAVFGRSLLYHPTRTTAAELAALAKRPGWQAAPVSVPGANLVGLVRPARGDVPWLVFYGGNAMAIGDAQAWLDLVSADLGWGAAVWAYRGYDGSSGTPSEGGLLADADTQVGHLAQRFGVGPRRIVVVGWSLGSGVAAATAATMSERGNPPKGVVMLSPYTSMAALFSDHAVGLPLGWAAPDSYRTDLRLPLVRCPILVVHGSEDSLIAVEHGRAVAKLAGERARYVELDTAHDVLSHPETLVTLRAFVGSLP